MEFIKKGKEEASVNINILLCGYPWFRTNHPRGLTKGGTGFFFFPCRNHLHWSQRQPFVLFNSAHRNVIYYWRMPDHVKAIEIMFND